MAQRGRGAAAGARPAARTGSRPAEERDRSRGDRTRDGRIRDDDRRPGIDLAAIRHRMRAIVEPAVVAAGLDLEDLAVVPAGRRLSVRVTVDGDDGVSHDELTEVSREISARLDAAEEATGELTPDSYTLEVSSPGVDRPLTLPRHWRRNVGRLVKARVTGAGAADRTLTGRITAVDDAGVTLDDAGRLLAVPFAGLGAGRVQVEFTRLADLDEFGDDDDLTDDDLADNDLADDEDLTDDDLADDEFDDDELYDEDGENSDPDDDEGAEPDLDLNGPQQKEDGS